MLRSGFLMWIISMVFIYPAIAQSNFNIDVQEKTSFTAVLLTLSKEHQLDFAYPSEEFALLDLEPMTYVSDDLDDLLTFLCDQADVEYRMIEQNQILFRKAESTLSSKSDLNRTYTLLPMEISINPITILDFHPFLMLNGIRLRSDNISTSGGFLGTDLLKQVQMSAGISADNDLDSEIRIRGSQGDETLIVLDEIPIINASHFWGIFSNINPSYVDDVQLYKNAIPINYSGATGGMVLMKSKKDIQDFKGQIDFGLLNSSAHLEIPIRNLTIEVAARASNKNFLNTGLYDQEEAETENRLSSNGKVLEIVSSSTPEFQFHDINTKIQYKITPGDLIQLNLFSSNDLYELSQDIEFSTTFNDKEYKTTRNYSEISEWQNRGLSIIYEKNLSDKWQLDLIGAGAKYSDEISFFTSLDRNNPERPILENKFSNHNEFSTFHLKGISHYKPSSKIGFKIGSALNKSSTILIITKREQAKLDLNTETNEYHFFGSSRFSLLNLKLITEVGLRNTYYSGTNKFYYQPQISSRYIQSDNLLFKMSLSRQIQFANELTHEDNFGRTFEFITLSNGLNLPVKSSNNFMLGLEFGRSSWSLDLEAYYKDIDGKIQHLTQVPGFVDDEETNTNGYQLIQGTGTTFGIDTRISYQHKQYSSSIEYTLSKSTDQFNAVYQGNEFRSSNDRRHQLKWMNEIQYKDYNYYCNFIYSSGLPYNDISLLMDGRDREDLRGEDFIKQLPHYGRIDIGAEKTFKLNGFELSLGGHVFNLANRQNVHALQYIYSIPNSLEVGPQNINTVIGAEVNQLDRTFNFTLGVKF